MRPFIFPNDLLRLLYMVFFKPISLDRYIHQVDPTLGRKPDLLTLWRRSREHPEFRSLVKLACFHILLTPWIPSLVIFALFLPTGSNMNFLNVVLAVGRGVLFSVMISLLFGLVTGVASGITFGLASVTDGISPLIFWGAGFMMGAIVFNNIMPIPIGLGGLIAHIVLDLTFGITYGIMFGTLFGVTVFTRRTVVFGAIVVASTMLGYIFGYVSGDSTVDSIVGGLLVTVGLSG